MLVSNDLIQPINLLVFVVNLLLQIVVVRHFLKILVICILVVQKLVLALELPFTRLAKELLSDWRMMAGSMLSVDLGNFIFVHNLLLL